MSSAHQVVGGSPTGLMSKWGKGPFRLQQACGAMLTCYLHQPTAFSVGLTFVAALSIC